MEMKDEDVKKAVREGYGKIANQGSCCCAPASSCCGSAGQERSVSQAMGYTKDELDALPEGADLGLGCGNPVALAALKEGETFLDLGSGAGIDCFLAAKRVGPSGHVIGVDMTPEMLERARQNAEKGGFDNVEFRLGEIEHLPVADNSADIIASNCVINLSPDKEAVFREAYRVLKPGGRLMISDIVLTKPLPDKLRTSMEAYVGCVSGAMLKDEYLALIRSAGFTDVKVYREDLYPVDSWVDAWLAKPTAKAVVEGLDATEDEVRELVSSVLSIKFSGTKPTGDPS
jgi:ubiquinone/menaquinone biosynthesis C-methylase UbiE